MSDALFARLVDPVRGQPLRQEAGRLLAGDGTAYPVAEGIADLVDEALLDPAARAEIEVFDSLPLQGVCYFRPKLFAGVIDRVKAAWRDALPNVAVEIGGGSGHFAAAYRRGTGGDAYVCDLSRQALRAAAPGLGLIRCDARRPFLAPGSVGLAAFWVSLHHLGTADRQAALEVACTALAPGGLLLVFEPSGHFLPRRLFMASPLARLVYFDDHEKPLDSGELQGQLAPLGLEPLSVEGVNPPYSPAFLRHFRLWPLFAAGTETLHGLDCLGDRLGMGTRNVTWGSYFLALYRKR